MNIQLGTLPVIDRALNLKLAGHNESLANDMLSLFTQSLQQELSTIDTLYQTKQLKQLTDQIHRLHGAAAYCGIPRFKMLLSHIEAQLKTGQTETLSELMTCLHNEAEQLIEQVL